MIYFFSIFFGTFLLEDVALVTAFKFVADGKLSLGLAFTACFLGITIGDILLYLVGRFSLKLGLEQRIKSNKKIKMSLYKMNNSNLMNYLIFISRVIPGTRLPTYIGAGLLKYPFWKFTVLTIISVALWVGGALAAGQSLHFLLMDHMWLSLGLFILFIVLVKKISPIITDPWSLKASLHFWRKWTSFEFWPSWFFYIPIVFYYIYLSIRYRSVFLPFYANPKILNGGLLGESKWDFLKHLKDNSPSTLKSFKIPQGTTFEDFLLILEKNHFDFPFIVKPDVGQRGFGVRIIRDEFDLTEYLLLSHFDLILQKLSDLPKEAGIFYVKIPKTGNEFIFSITDKKFPYVLGDGKSKLGDLILNDSRAKIIPQTYFARHKESLDQIIPQGEKFQISECGNHCQGAIFINGQNLNSEKLLTAVSGIARQIPEFYFGRFDVRYKDEVSLKKGEFQIIEINGAGSEATHIWDANTKLIDAYTTLFQQWRLIFEIGHQVSSDINFQSNINIAVFLTESFKVYFRKEKLSVSS